MKVYCGDCKHYYESNPFMGSDCCNHPQNWTHTADETYFETGDFGHFTWIPKNHNKDNDCNLFKPKWYRRGKYRNR